MAELNQKNIGFRMENRAEKGRQEPDYKKYERPWCHAKQSGFDAPSDGESFL